MNISNGRLKRSAEHVYYEHLMFLFAIKKLAQLSQIPQPNQIYINAFLECFVVHLRNLFDFYYTSASKRKNQDDMLAEDYIRDINLFKGDRTPKHKLSYISKRANKQFAHLTYHRNRYNSRTKPWKFGKIHSMLYPTIKSFYLALPDNRKKWLHFNELKKIIDNYTIIEADKVK